MRLRSLAWPLSDRRAGAGGRVGQGTVADYERAMTLRDSYQGLAVNVPEQTTLDRPTNRFWYRRSVKGGYDFVLVNADARSKEAAVRSREAGGRPLVRPGRYTAVDASVHHVHVRRQRPRD